MLPYTLPTLDKTKTKGYESVTTLTKSSKTMGTKLSVQWEQFCREYLLDFNGEKAAIRAGFSAKSARFRASKLLANDNIRQRLGELTAAKYEELDISLTRITHELACIAFFDPAGLYDEDGHLLPINQIPEHIRRAVQGSKSYRRQVGFDKQGEPVYENTVDLKLSNKLKALDMLARYTGLYEQGGIGGGNVYIFKHTYD